MTRRAAWILAACALAWVIAVAACGRYGKPVRSAPSPGPESGAPEQVQDVDLR